MKPTSPHRSRRATAAMLATAGLLSLPVAAGAVHWPGLGGDAGHSGHQPLGQPVLPIGFVRENTASDTVRTSPVISAGTDVDQVYAWGTHDTDSGAATIFMNNLVTGTSFLRTGNAADNDGIDIDSPPTSDTDSFGPAPGGVTPVDSSSGGSLGQLFVVHNDDNSSVPNPNQQVGGMVPSNNDIAIAQIDERATGTNDSLVKDVGIGEVPNLQTGNLGLTDGYTIKSSPVITPVIPAGSGTRYIFFVAEGPGGIGKLFRITVTDAGARSASFAFTRLDTPPGTTGAVEDLNPDASPSIVYLVDPARGPDVVPYVLVAARAAAGRSDLRTYKISNFEPGPAVPADLPGVPRTPSIPVETDGTLPGESNGGKAPAIYVAYDDGSDTTVRKFVQTGDNATLSNVASGDVEGSPSPGLAVSQVVTAGQADPGRVVVATSQNVIVLSTESMQPVERFRDFPSDPNDALLASPLGFTRTVPAVTGDLIFIARDNGNHLVLSLADAERVPTFGNGGFSESPSNNTSSFAVGQPALSRGFVLFGSTRPVTGNVIGSMFVYQGSLRPDVAILEPGVNEVITTPTFEMQARATDDSAIVRVDFKVDGRLKASDATADPGNIYEGQLDVTELLEGRHTLRVEATDDDGNVGAAERAFTVNRFADPTAAITASPPTTVSGEKVTLDATGSAPTPDEGNETLVKYEFDPEGDGTFVDNGSSAKRDVTYASPGTYSATVRVTDSHGDIDTASTTVTVNNRPPTATFTISPNPARRGQVVTFDGSGSTDLDGTIAKYEWDLDGNGSFETDGGTNPSISVSAPAAGTYNIKLRVTDNAGATSEVARDLVVGGNAAPTAALTISPVTARTGTTVTLDASASRDPDGRIVRFEFDLDGNGSFETVTGATPRTTRTYRVPGVFNVKVKVTDNEGATAEAARALAITGQRAAPRSVTLKVTPRRDRVLPLRFTASGRLSRPTGITASRGCLGRVSIQVKIGNRTISSRRTRLTSRCTYRLRVSFRDRKRLGTRKALRFTARFQGNAALRARSSRTVQVRIG